MERKMGSLTRSNGGYREELNGIVQTITKKARVGTNHNQVFTLFISCLNTLVRNIAGNGSGLRAHKKSSWHFDFSSFLALIRAAVEFLGY